MKFKSRASIEKQELAWLLAKLIDKKPKVIVEIGVHRGYSLEVWRNWFNPEILIGVESDTSQLDYLTTDYIMADIIEGDSRQAATQDELILALGGRKIDFLFIDGDHSYEGVKQDYEMYSPLVAKGGVIAFHDAAIKDHPLVKVYEFMAELPGVEVYQKDGTGMAVVYV